MINVLCFNIVCIVVISIVYRRQIRSLKDEISNYNIPALTSKGKALIKLSSFWKLKPITIKDRLAIAQDLIVSQNTDCFTLMLETTEGRFLMRDKEFIDYQNEGGNVSFRFCLIDVAKTMKVLSGVIVYNNQYLVAHVDKLNDMAVLSGDTMYIKYRFKVIE